MRIIDITVPIHENMACFPGTDCPKFTQVRTFEEDRKNVWKLEFSTVTGTHVIAPLHNLPGGRSVDELDPALFYGPCEVREVKGKDDLIAFTEVMDVKSPRVLFKTSNSAFVREDKFYDDYVALSAEAAETLVQNGVRLVGIDYYGIERRGSLDHPVHRTLLQAGVAVIVGLDLSSASLGTYTLAAFPIKIKGVDGAPCRAVLIKE